ncbi:MAG: acyltransferase [Sporocytophaga sp.]|nr:acyltransferase [Sporocytophaga sp.]
MEINNQKTFERTLEGLRGLAALFVILYHVIVLDRFPLDPAFKPSGIWGYSAPGHSSVLVFFMLSGLVIGISTKDQLKGPKISTYVKKRFIRIYPIYLFAILLSIFFVSKIDWEQVRYHLFFLHVPFKAVFNNNGSLWSLNYEIFYYTLFIGFSYFKIEAKWIISLLVFFISLSFLFAKSIFLHDLILGYSIGLLFWIIGYYISQMERKDETYPSNHLLALIFLWMSLEFFNTFSPIYASYLEDFKKNVYLFFRIVNYSDLFFLPFCFILLVIACNKNVKYYKYLLILVFILPLPVFIHKTFVNPIVFTNRAFFFPSLFYVLSIIILFGKQIKFKVPEFLNWFGGISYAAYAIHVPILALFKEFDILSGSLLTYIIRLILFLSLVLGISYVLEKKMQPYVKRLLMRSSDSLKYNV